MLRKGIYPYKYMNSWQKFNEASRSTESVSSEVSQALTSNTQKEYGKILEKKFRSNLHVESDTLLPVDIFGSFRNNSLEIYEVDPAYFI